MQDSDVGTYRQVRPTCQPGGGCIYKERIPLNLRRPAGAFPQKNLRAPPLCIPSFNKRLCAVPAYVHFEKQRTHLVGTSLHPLAGRQPKSGIRRKRKKPRCVQDGDVGTGDVGTYRQVRPTCQPAEGCYYKERMPLHLRRPPPLHTVFYQRLYAVPAYVHFEKQRTHLIGTSLHLLADRQPKSRIWRKRKKENTANVSLYVFNIF